MLLLAPSILYLFLIYLLKVQHEYQTLSVKHLLKIDATPHTGSFESVNSSPNKISLYQHHLRYLLELV